MGLGRLIPPRVGYWLSNLAARFLSQKADSPMVRAVRSNQAVIRGLSGSDPALDQAVVEAFTHAGHCMFDLYHNLQNPDALKKLAPINPAQRGRVWVSVGWVSTHR